MANLFQNTTSGAGELKTFFQGPMINGLNEELPIYRACEKIKQGWSGSQVVRAIRVRRNQGIGATSDGGNLPSIGRQNVQQATINAKYNYLRFGVTAVMMKASQSDVRSFVRSAAYELKQGYLDLKSDMSRQLSYDGTGSMAAVNTAPVASTALVIAGRTSTEPALKFIDVGTIFDITDGTTIKASGVTVVAIPTGTPAGLTATLTLDQPVTCLTTDVLIRSGSLNNEIQGLGYALDGATTSVYSVDRSLYLAFQGNVTDNAAAQLSLNAMQTPFNEGLRRGNAQTYNAVWTDFTSLLYYQKLLTPDKRYANTVEGDGTFGSKGKFYLDFNGISVVPDKDCPTSFYFLPAEVLKMYTLCEMEFADETGSMYITQTDVDAWEVRIRHFTNLFNESPASCARLKNYISP